MTGSEVVISSHEYRNLRAACCTVIPYTLLQGCLLPCFLHHRNLLLSQCEDISRYSRILGAVCLLMGGELCRELEAELAQAKIQISRTVTSLTIAGLLLQSRSEHSLASGMSPMLCSERAPLRGHGYL